VRRLKHAFAVEPPGPCEPDAAERPVVDRLCREVVRRRLTTPALLYLEVSRPLHYIGSQAMHFFRPIVAALFDTRGYELFTRFLERRGSVDYLVRRLESLEDEADRASRASTTRQGPEST
jgi:hypothetical protein